MRQLGQHEFEHDPGRDPARPADIARRARAARATPRARPGPPAPRPARTSPRTAGNRRQAARHATPVRELASMSPPTELVKKARPARMKIAANQGSTSTRAHISPRTGRSRHSQAPERSRIASVTMASPTNIRISGPLSRMPPASAVQKIAGQLQADAPDRRRAARKIDARHRTHRGDRRSTAAWRRSWRAALRRRAGPSAHMISAASSGAAPRHEGERGPVGQQHRADGADQGWDPVEPDARLRAAARPTASAASTAAACIQ